MRKTDSHELLEIMWSAYGTGEFSFFHSKGGKIKTFPLENTIFIITTKGGGERAGEVYF